MQKNKQNEPILHLYGQPYGQPAVLLTVQNFCCRRTFVFWPYLGHTNSDLGGSKLDGKRTTRSTTLQSYTAKMWQKIIFGKLFLESYFWKVIFRSCSNCKLVDVKNRSHDSLGAWERFILDSQTTREVDYQHIMGNHPNLAYLS